MEKSTTDAIDRRFAFFDAIVGIAVSATLSLCSPRAPSAPPPGARVPRKPGDPSP
jgi:hypothetical protein